MSICSITNLEVDDMSWDRMCCAERAHYRLESQNKSASRSFVMRRYDDAEGVTEVEEWSADWKSLIGTQLVANDAANDLLDS